jgi:hypothetical protein
MENTDKRIDETWLWRSSRGRLRLECRECEVICERVVSPWRCLRSKCPGIYSYQDRETTYFGCLHKVFSPELDLAAFADERVPSGRGSDPYGALRVRRSPRPECKITIEHAYEVSFGGATCCNPTFFHHPLGPVEDTIRLTTRPSDGDSGRQG